MKKVKRGQALVVLALAALIGLRLGLNLQAERRAAAERPRVGNPEYLAMGRSLSREGRMRVVYDAEAFSARKLVFGGS